MTAFGTSAAVGLTDRSYFEFVLSAAERARRRIWASIFLYDLRPSRDIAGSVLDLTNVLVRRSAVGVDVRVLVSGQVTTPDIAVANRATALFLTRHGVPNRHVVGEPDSGRQGSHAKFAVLDDVAVLGSQNWTDDAFRLNVEDAVALTGDVIDVLAAQFQSMWRHSRGLRR